MTGFKVFMAVGSGSYTEILTAPSKTNPTITTHTQSSGLITG